MPSDIESIPNSFPVIYNPELITTISKKNLGQLLTTLDALNCSDVAKSMVKTFFWKNADDIKMSLESK